MAKLDSLIVDLQVNTAELKKGLEEANAKLKDFDKSMKELAGIVELNEIGSIAKEVGEKLVEFAMHGAEVADQMGKMAQSAGISVESFSRLNYAAAIAHVGTEDLGVAFKKLDTAIAQAAAGSIKQATLFEALGVSVKNANGSVRAADDVLGDVADRFASMEDGASKSALAVEVFGKSGTKLIPFLNQGRDGLKALGEEADRLGITLSGSTVKSATEFNDNVEKMKRSLDAVATNVAAQLAPAMADLTKQFLNSKDGAQALKDLADVLAAALKVLATVAVGVAAAFNVVGTTIGAAASILLDAIHGNFEGAKATMATLGKEVVADFTAAGERIASIWKGTTDAAKEAADETAKAHTLSADKIVANHARMEKAAEAYQKAEKELVKLAAEYTAKVAGFGKGPVEELSEKLESGALTHGVKIASDEFKRLRDTILDAATAMLALQSKQLQIKIDFDVRQANLAALKQSTEKAQEFDAIGKDPLKVLADQLAQSGFKDFNDALEQFAEQTQAHAQALGAIEQAKLHGDLEGEQAAKELAARTQESATQAGKAADKFKTLAEKQLTELESQIDHVNHAIAATLSTISSKLGELGGVIQGVVQGFQSGGIYGAIAAFIIELFSRFKRFTEIVTKATDQLYGAIQQLSPFFDKLTNGFLQFQTMLGSLTNVIDELVTPIITTVAKSLGWIAQALTPLLGAVGAAIEPLITILTTFEQIAEAVIPFQGAINLLAIVFNGVSLGILTVVGWIEQALADFLETVRQVLADLGLNDAAKAVSVVELSIALAAQTAKDQADALNEKLTAQLDDPFATAGNQVNTGKSPTDTTVNTTTTDLGNLGNQANTTAAQIQKIGESLTNIPQGFKYALRAYQATSASDVYAPGGTGGSGSSGTGGGHRPGLTSITINVSGGIMTTVEAFAGLIQDTINKQQFQSGGAPPTNTNPYYHPHF